MLNVILLAFLLVVIRCWHLSFVQYEERLQRARRPQQKVVIEPAKRATIRDRYNIPLALNKMHYQAAILYTQIKEVPAIVWQKDPVTGKKERIYRRKAYIQELASLLSRELELDEERLIDLIYSKASLYGHIPFVVKEEVTERQYYRLKMLEREWPGIVAMHYPQRHYPKGKVASDIIGHMGAINRQEYEEIMGEMRLLERYLTSIDEGGTDDLPEGFNSYSEVKARLNDIKDKAYNINDQVGKSGIEGLFEEELRGFHGKKIYSSDARGNFLRELPGGREPLSGKRLLLTISSELQEYAEELLIKNEQIREARVSLLKNNKAPKEPWIKGGAIIAMDPTTGELLALASTPRYDPNDFVACGTVEEREKKNGRISRWFETESYLAGLWDQKHGLYRERFDHKYGIVEEEQLLDWKSYLESILPATNPIVEVFRSHPTIKEAIVVQSYIEELMTLFESYSIYDVINTLYSDDEGHQTYGNKIGAVTKGRLEERGEKHRGKIDRIKRELDRIFQHIPSNYDKILYIDLTRLAVRADTFSKELLAATGGHSISDYRNASAAMARVSDVVEKMTRELFHHNDFAKWRKENEKEYLKKKRQIEKEKKSYQRPYIDYIDAKERKMFREFWGRYRWQFLTAFLTGKWMEFHPDEEIAPYLSYFLQWHSELERGAHSNVQWVEAYTHLQRVLKNYPVDIAIEYFQTLRSYEELNRPLYGKYRNLRKEGGQQLEKHLATGFYPKYGYGFARSHAYRQAATLGSIFKIVTAYEALVQQFRRLNNPYISMQRLNPLTLDDQYFKVGKEEYVAISDKGVPIPRYYKGGRLPKSLSRNIGKIDILSAIERSSNPYFSLLAGDCMENCRDLEGAARLFSFGEKTGVMLPQEIAGRVPDDLEENRTGLYSLAIGQHSLVVTPLQTAVMLSTIANGGKVLEPKILHLSVGRVPSRDREIPICKPPYLYHHCYQSVGLDFPLFTAAVTNGRKSVVQKTVPTLLREIFLPEQVRRILMEGMSRVVLRSQQIAIGSLQTLYKSDPSAIRDLLALKGHLVGKTSTAESVENIDMDRELGTNKYNHLWFGGISLRQEEHLENSHLFKDKFGQPELVVVVYLRYGAYGKDTMPLAAQIVKKWREIKNRHSG